jgi:DNA repair exonuclease SbcCD ATPase subunit
MDQDETKQDSEIEKLTTILNQVSGELNTLKASIEKRKSETTTLKILFYTGIAVLLIGFIYTNQTLQRAQSHNLETNIIALQSRVNHALFSLERKLHEEITTLESRVNANPSLQEVVKKMNRALSALRPETQTMNTLIKKVQRDSQELSNMVLSQQNADSFTPEAVP